MTSTSTFKSPEFGVTFENYLNFYHGIDNVDTAKISHFVELTPEQKSVYESFVKQVEAHDFRAVADANTTADGAIIPYVLPDRITMLRFLAADDFESELALQRLVNTIKFQQDQRLAEKLSTTPPKLDVYRRIRVRAKMGRTKDGMPVFVERLAGFMNGIPSKEGKSLTDDEWIHCFFYDVGELVRAIKESHELADPITWKVTWIMDVRGISYYKALKALSVIKLLDGLMEPNFPEISGPIFMINVPYVVTGIWKLAKAFLDPAVVAKIQIHSGVPKEALLERIDESVLFREYGGTNPQDFPKSDYI